MRLLWLALLLLSCQALANDKPSCGTACTFVLLEDNGQLHTVINPERAKTPFTPFSTFKIPNTLIALDTGVITDLSQPLSFDAERFPVQSWWREIWYKAPLTIRPAFQNSAVPIYQQLAVDVGKDRMQTYLNEFDYGNKDISSGLHSFWLNGSIQISAIQQAQFLRRLFNDELALDPKTLEMFEQVMLVEETPDYHLYAKTGAGSRSADIAIGWYVGAVIKADKRYYFALNLDGSSFAEILPKRVSIARAELQKAEIINQGPN